MQCDIYVQCGRHICSGAYTNDVKCMYTSAAGYTVHCSEFIEGIYTDIGDSYLYMYKFAYVAYIYI